MLPALFISHGAPDRLLKQSPARSFLQQLAGDLPGVKAVLVLSAHWLSPKPEYTGPGPLKTIHDFGGFADELYRIDYPASGESWLCEALAQCLEGAGVNARQVDRGLDHGAWTPLYLMYPQAQIPIIALSLPATAEFQRYLELGRLLGPLRERGILILSSGSATHNLAALSHRGQAPEWAVAFTHWLQDRALAGDLEALADYRQRSPAAAVAHPSDEHYVPLLVAAAAAEGEAVRLVHDSWEYGSLNNSCFAFGAEF